MNPSIPVLRIRDFSSTRIGSFKSKTSTKIIRKSYLYFLREKSIFVKKCNMAIWYYLRVKICINFERNQNFEKILKFFDIMLDSSRIRIKNFVNRIRCKIVWIRNTAVNTLLQNNILLYYVHFLALVKKRLDPSQMETCKKCRVNKPAVNLRYSLTAKM